jgi:hypothetical protein
MKDLFSPNTRSWIYGVVGTIVPLLVTLGVLTGEVAGHVLAIAAAVLSVGSSALAYANVSRSTEDETL